jgi:uncharacterized protein (UPF0332 family)
MCHFISKSNKLVGSADLLHDSQHYHAVPHCSYYACFQLLKHICIHKLGLSENQIMGLSKESEEGSHEFTVNQAIKFIESQNSEDSRIDTSILLLKKLRMRADYKNVEIVSDESSKAIKLSKTIIPVLSRYCQ